MNREGTPQDPPWGQDRRKVLVVDDRESMTRFLVRALDRKGYAAWSAPSAESALELLAAQAFDVILLDVELPGMTGLEALTRIAEVSRAQVVLMSGGGGDDLRRDAKLLGAKAVLMKPFDIEDLDGCLSGLTPSGGEGGSPKA